MITVTELIKELKNEDQDRLVRRAQVVFDDQDRFVVLRGEVHASAKRREKEKKEKEPK